MRRHRPLAPAVALALSLAAVAGVSAQPPTDRPVVPTAKVRLGIDVLERDGFTLLKGQRVGLVTNPTGVTSDLRPTLDVLHRAPGVRLVAIYGPEHGARGDVPAGDQVDDARDAATGLPVYSLYGKTRKPTPEMLADLDVLVYDIQDIGSRSYTFISTLALVQEAAAEHKLPVVVLDRPNPLGGLRVEGRPLDLKFQSFVGQLPIPYIHGMTVGELALMANGEKWLNGGVQCDLTVVKMEGWRRAMRWEQTGLTWVPTSPHVPRADSAAFYAATGILGELHFLSEGVGYTLPFELIGAPWLEPQKLADELNARRLPGVYFRPLYFQPYYGQFAKEPCGGVQILLTDPDRVELTPIQFHALDAVRKLVPDRKPTGDKRDGMFDKVCGTDRIRKLVEAGRPVDEILAAWREGVDEFRAQRAKYLLYE